MSHRRQSSSRPNPTQRTHSTFDQAPADSTTVARTLIIGRENPCVQHCGIPTYTGHTNAAARRNDGQIIAVFTTATGSADGTGTRHTQLHLGWPDESGNCRPATDRTQNGGVSSRQSAEKISSLQCRATASLGPFGRCAYSSWLGQRNATSDKTRGTEHKRATKIDEPQMMRPALPMSRPRH